MIELILSAGVITIAAVLQSAARFFEMAALLLEHRGTSYDDC